MLSMAGRATLAKSVLQTILSYIMQSVMLPSSFCDEIDKKSKAFVWRKDNHNRKLHTVKWSELCTSKKAGGLGLRSTRAMNKTFMMKAWWRLSTRKDSLSAQVVRHKYKCGMNTPPVISEKKNSSNF